MPNAKTQSCLNGAVWSVPRADELPPEELAADIARLGCTTFGVHAPLLLQNGYSPVPIEPGRKRPLGVIGDWNRLRDKPLTPEDIDRIAKSHPTVGLGVIGGFGGLVPVDVDTDEEAIVAAIAAALPPPQVSKRGRRGVTHFYWSNLPIPARKLRQADGTPLVEILTTGQTVIPPTIHPECKQPYHWIDEDLTLLTVPSDGLEAITADHIGALQAALTPWMAPPREYVSRRASATQPAPTRMRAYAGTIMNDAASVLGCMPKDSGRNRQLFDAASKLGRYVHHDVLPRAEVEDVLIGACRTNGLIAEDGLRKCQQSLESGLRKAECDDLPALEDRPRPRGRTSAGSGHGHDAQAVDHREDVHARPWPLLPPPAMRGLAGELARVATAHSEADPVAVMMTALTGAGALFGRARYMRVGDTQHHARLMCALVGATARGRKGTSWSPVQRLLRQTEAVIQLRSTLPFPMGLPLRISHGPLSSGEGLAAAIRDAVGDDDDSGTKDKRLLVVEGEFGAALRAMQRQGNTLSMTLRTAWDGHDIEPLTKHDRVVVTAPHICIVAHITREELRQLLSASDVWGGLANRLLWTCVRRSAIVPAPKGVTDEDLDRLASELARAALHAHAHPAELRMSNTASDLWVTCYPELTLDRPGLLGAATARAEVQVLRLALTYALVDGAERIEEDHLEAGLAMWRYADDSAAYLFGSSESDPVRRRILEALATGPKSQSDIRDVFGRHEPSARLLDVLRDMQEGGRITLSVQQTGGRPRQVWNLARK